MNPILAGILQQFEGPLVAAVAQRLGIDPATAAKAVSVAVPVILSVLAHRGAAAQAGGSPQQLLGPHSDAVVQGISQSAGISPAQAQQLISMVAPQAMEQLRK